MEENNISIYKSIIDNINKDAKLPYEFQNIYTDGKKDILFALWGENPLYEERVVYSKTLIKLILSLLEGKQSKYEIKCFLDKQSICFYYDLFIRKLKVYYLENIIDKEKLYSYGIYLSTESDNCDEVKLGILILSLYENDITKKIIKVLGLHSEYTLYAVEAIKNFNMCNTIILDFLKGTEGYGKLIALHRLNVIDEKVEKTIIEIGYKNKVIPHITSIFVLEKADLYNYLSGSIDIKKFNNISNIIAYAFEETDIQEFNKSGVVIEKYMEYAKLYNKEFIDLVAIANIHKNMVSRRKRNKENREYKNGWNEELENKIREETNSIMLQRKWKHVILEELSKLRYNTSMIVTALEAIGFRPEFEEFYYILSMDNFDLELFEYMLFECGKFYIKDMVSYISYVAPWEEILSNTINEDKEEVEYTADIIIEFLLSRMREIGENDEEFFLKCLKSRLPKCRIEAVKCLGRFKKIWSENVILELNEAYEKESNSIVKNLIGKFTGKEVSFKYKKEKYVDLESTDIIPSKDDIVLVKCSVAGAFYSNLYIIDTIQKDAILYLKTEPNNIYDSNAVIVADVNGYVIGYVPKKYNTIIFKLLENKEDVYAVINRFDLAEYDIEIDIILNRNMVRKEGFKIVKR